MCGVSFPNTVKRFREQSSQTEGPFEYTREQGILRNVEVDDPQKYPNCKSTQTDDVPDGTNTSQDEDEKTILKDIGLFAVKTAVISGAILGGVAIAVPAMGFGAGGVAAGSMAAAYQSSVLGGTIAAGSGFAMLQSIGAAGLALSTQVGVVAVSAITTAAATMAEKVF